MPSTQRNESLVVDFQTQAWVGGVFAEEWPFKFQPISNCCLSWDLFFSPPRVLCVQSWDRYVCDPGISVYCRGKLWGSLTCLIVFPKFLLWKKTSTNTMSGRVQLSSGNACLKLSADSGCTYEHAFFLNLSGESSHGLPRSGPWAKGSSTSDLWRMCSREKVVGEAEQGRKGLARANFSLVPGELWNVSCAQVCLLWRKGGWAPTVSHQRGSLQGT